MGIVKRARVSVHLFFHLKAVFVFSVLVAFPLRRQLVLALR
jgi:hypothetical protein